MAPAAAQSSSGTESNEPAKMDKARQRSKEEREAVSDSDSDESQDERRKKAKVTKESKKKATTSRGRGRPIPILTAEKQIDGIKKQNKTSEQLYAKYPTMDSFLKAIDSLPIGEPLSTLFKGCRIIFVYHNGPNDLRALDRGLIDRILLILHHGGRVLAPEAFVPAPARSGESDVDWEARATREQWTTHIVAHGNYLEKQLEFGTDVVPALGSGDLTEGEVGEFVKAVEYPWVAENVVHWMRNGRREGLERVSEEHFLIRRASKESDGINPGGGGRRTLENTKGARYGRGKNAKGKRKQSEELDYETSQEEGEGDEDFLGRQRRAFSPFQINCDWPVVSYDSQPAIDVEME